MTNPTDPVIPQNTTSNGVDANDDQVVATVGGAALTQNLSNPVDYDTPDNEANPARISTRKLVEYCLTHDVVHEADLVGLLGETRHHLTLLDLERALIRSSLMSESRLGRVKSEISGYPFLASLEAGIDTSVLPEQSSRALGAVHLSAATTMVGQIEPTTSDDPFTTAESLAAGRPVVAIVEDTVATVAHLAEIFGTDPFLVAVTVGQFTELHRVGYKGAARSARKPLPDVYNIFDEAVRNRASDIHLSVGLPPTLRIDGKLHDLPYEDVDAAWIRSEIGRIGGPARLARLEQSHDVDMAFPYGSARFRVNFGAAKQGLTIAARKIPTKIPTMDDLGLPRSVQQFANLDRGLVLVTGATGSGKSTTLAALLAHIASDQLRHIITLEDPIEFLLPRGRGVVNQREHGSSFTSFPDGLRQALRQDPDVILVGEMRDLDTVRTAVTAAETGHLVFGTLHTYDAASTVSRVVSMYPTDEQEQIRATLSYTLKGIVSQSLLRSAAGVGRVAAFEVMVSNSAIANNLRRVDGAAMLRSALETGAKDGMQTMDMALADLVRRRMVTEEEAAERAVDPVDFKRRLEN